MIIWLEGETMAGAAAWIYRAALAGILAGLIAWDDVWVECNGRGCSAGY
jgi:hypothetical protein